MVVVLVVVVVGGGGGGGDKCRCPTSRSHDEFGPSRVGAMVEALKVGGRVGIPSSGLRLIAFVLHLAPLGFVLHVFGGVSKRTTKCSNLVSGGRAKDSVQAMHTSIAAVTTTYHQNMLYAHYNDDDEEEDQQGRGGRFLLYH